MKFDDRFDVVFGGDLYTYLVEVAEKGLLIENNKLSSRFDRLRSMFIPIEDSEYNQTSTHRQIDPSPLNSLDRAVANLLSYHYNPRDKFIKLTTQQDISDNVKAQKELQKRTDTLHKIFQDPENMFVEGMCKRDCLVFGMATKVLEENDDIVVKKLYYSPEQTISLSSNGKYYDIFGVKEKISYFELGIRWDVLSEPLKEMVESEYSDIYDGRDVEVYRLNIKEPVLYYMLKRKFSPQYGKGSDRKMSDLEKYIAALKVKKNGTDWIDIVFTEYGIVSLEKRPVRNIIINYFFPPNNSLELPRSQGEKNLKVGALLMEIQHINLTGYERTYAPAWNFPDEAALKGADLTRDGIIYSGGDATGQIRPLSLGANVQGMEIFNKIYQDKYDKTFFLDAFSLLQQTHMTKGEVTERRSDDFRQLGLYVISDEKTSLIPETAFANYVLDNTKGMTSLDELGLTARYMSPLAYAHRNNVLDNTDRLVATLGAMFKTLAQEGNDQIRAVVDMKKWITNLFVNMDTQFALTEEEEGERVDAQNDNRRELNDRGMELDNQLKEQNLVRENMAMTGGQVGG